jgi:hypothetical protein
LLLIASQIYNGKLYIPIILSIILLKTPYFDPKKFTRASFLFTRVKSVGIRSVVNPFRLGIKKPRTVSGPGLFGFRTLATFPV